MEFSLWLFWEWRLSLTVVVLLTPGKESDTFQVVKKCLSIIYLNTRKQGSFWIYLLKNIILNIIIALHGDRWVLELVGLLLCIKKYIKLYTWNYYNQYKTVYQLYLNLKNENQYHKSFSQAGGIGRKLCFLT